MVNQKQLIELGFSPKEASVYLSLLELGPSTTTEIARKAKINRTTGYDILESLTSEGLVYLVGETKIQKYAAENPQKVIKFLENRIKKTEEQLNAAHNLLPQLFSIYNTKEKPRVKFFEGLEEMKEAFEDTLTAKGELLAYAVGNDMYTAFNEKYFSDYFKKRTAKNISVRVIAPDDEGSKKVIANDAAELRTSRLVPKDKFYFSVETNIYNNKILIVSWKEKFAVIIESEEISDAQRKIFELAWLGAKNINLR
ncbi:MAG: helix-turn-helix domain-containing protein [Patescibacteria group bacterium]